MSNTGQTVIGLDQAVALVVPREIRDALFIAAAHAWNTGEVSFDHELAKAVDAVADVLMGKVNCKFRKIGINDCFGQSGKAKDVLREYGLTADQIAAKIKETL